MVMRRTAMGGKMIDMEALRVKNEKTRAVGNMNVNARGDVIDGNNEVISDNTQRVNRMYKRTMNAPLTRPPADTPEKVEQKQVAKLEPDEANVKSEAELEFDQEDIKLEPPKKTNKKS